MEYDTLTVPETEYVVLAVPLTLALVDPLNEYAGVCDTLSVPLTEPHIVALDETDKVSLTVPQLLAETQRDTEGLPE